MIWKKKKQCIVCGFYSRIGEKIHNSFFCYPCEMDMVESLARDQEDREEFEIDRINRKIERETNER